MEAVPGDGLAPSIPSWAQSEAASAQSGPQQIAPEMHNKVFSWAEVKEIVGKCSCNKKNSCPESLFQYIDTTSTVLWPEIGLTTT